MMIRLLAAVAVTLAMGCGGSSLGGDGGVGDGDGGTGGVDARDNSCTTAEMCPSGQVCNPATNRCADDVSCTMHSDCGPAAHCSTTGSCEPSSTGDTCETADNCISTEGCVGGHCGCGGDEYLAEAVPPNLLIVLDKSGSMSNDGGGMSKWDIAKGAIANLLTTYDGAIQFGLSLYPSNSSCGAGNVNVGIGPGTSAMITTTLNSTSPNGSTPIGPTLNAMVSYMGLEDTTRENYILLITDGSENCGNPLGPTAAGTLISETPSVKTFVIGFGSGVDATSLNDTAVAGGTALANGPPYYYQADNAAQLQMALDAIGGAVLSCTYTLDQVPEDADFFVYFDDVLVGTDPTNGWTYDPVNNTVTFSGTSCDSLRTGVVTDLVIVHNCPIGVN